MQNKHLSNQQAMELATFDFTFIDNVRLHKIARFDSSLEADKKRQPGEIIGVTKTAAFILSPKLSKPEKCEPIMSF